MSEPKDNCSEVGAKRLARTIERYWADRGLSVTVTTKRMPFHVGMRIARTDVRSDMVNGYPRRRKAGKPVRRPGDPSAGHKV